MITKEEITKLSYSNGIRLPEKLEEIVSWQEDSSLKSPGVEAHYYRFFYWLFDQIRPALTLELGTHTGISAACMAEGNPNGLVITVNNHEELWEKCRRPNVEYRIHDSLVPIQPQRLINVLFIDTEHDGIRCLNEFNLYQGWMAEDGIVFIDDITLFPCMREFWEKFNPVGWEKFDIPAHGDAGFGCLIRRR